MQTKTALITGSTSGIGLGIAKAFAQKGYNIVFNGLEENGVQIAQEVAQEFGVQAFFSGANLLKETEIQQMVTQTYKTFGSIQVLVNNAGIQHVAPIDKFPADKWSLIIGVNLSAAFHTSKAVWQGMKTQKFGRIINISSAHGLRASAFKSAYVSSKHGVIGLTKVLGLEGAVHNITCNAICPGYVRTTLVKGQIADQAKVHQMTPEEVIEKVLLKKHAIKKFVTVEEIGNLALFLASDHAQTITGTSIPMDGGWTAQ